MKKSLTLTALALSALFLSACQTTVVQPKSSDYLEAIKQTAQKHSQTLHALPKTHTANFADIAYDTKDSRQKLDIYLPKKSSGNAPMIFYIHGGGWTGGDKIEVAGSPMGVDKMIARLLDNGYAVVSVDYRLAPDYLMPAQTDDVSKVFEFIVKNGQKYGLDSKRIAVMGESAGGHLAQWLSVTQGKHLKASVPFYGVSDVVNLQKMLRANPLCQNVTAAQFYRAAGVSVPDDFVVEEMVFGGKAGSPTFIQNATKGSAIYHINQDTPPTLLFHGSNDCTIDHEQSVVFLQKLQEHQIPSELITLEGEGHATAKFWITPQYQEKVLAFLNKYL